MCRYSSGCRLNCTDALACSDVDAAFGPKRITTSSLSGWRSAPKPKAPPKPKRRDPDRCSMCKAPRAKGRTLCAKHQLQRNREYKAATKEKKVRTK